MVTANRQSSRVVRSAPRTVRAVSHDHSKAHHEKFSDGHHKTVTHKPKSHQSHHTKESENKDKKTKTNRPVKPGKNKHFQY